MIRKFIVLALSAIVFSNAVRADFSDGLLIWREGGARGPVEDAASGGSEGFARHAVLAEFWKYVLAFDSPDTMTDQYKYVDLSAPGALDRSISPPILDFRPYEALLYWNLHTLHSNQTTLSEWTAMTDAVDAQALAYLGTSLAVYRDLEGRKMLLKAGIIPASTASLKESELERAGVLSGEYRAAGVTSASYVESLASSKSFEAALKAVRAEVKGRVLSAQKRRRDLLGIASARQFESTQIIDEAVSRIEENFSGVWLDRLLYAAGRSQAVMPSHVLMAHRPSILKSILSGSETPPGSVPNWRLPSLMRVAVEEEARRHRLLRHRLENEFQSWKKLIEKTEDSKGDFGFLNLVQTDSAAPAELYLPGTSAQVTRLRETILRMEAVELALDQLSVAFVTIVPDPRSAASRALEREGLQRMAGSVDPESALYRELERLIRPDDRATSIYQALE